MPAINHVHTYIRYKKVKESGNVLYKCNDPLCTHTIDSKLAIGKLTVCSVCRRNQFILIREDLRLARPRCPECSQRESARKRRQVKSVLIDLIPDITRIEEKDDPEFI